MRIRLNLETAQARASEYLKSLGHEFVSFPDGYVNDRSKLIALCANHGKFEMQYGVAMYQKSNCQKCAKESTAKHFRSDQSEIARRIRKRCRESGLIFVGFSEEYSNLYSLVALKCKIHGVRKISVAAALSGKKCQYCARIDAGIKARKPEQEIIKEMNVVLSSCNSRFSRWETEYTGNKSYAIICCSIHGESRKKALKIIQGQGCPSCSYGGFNPSQAGFVYALKSDCGAYLKIGITNNVENRMIRLSETTPFGFNKVAEIRFDHGIHARKLEKETHAEFMGAGLSGFDGATEWLRYDPEIIEYIQQRAN